MAVVFQIEAADHASAPLERETDDLLQTLTLAEDRVHEEPGQFITVMNRNPSELHKGRACTHDGHLAN